MLFGITLNLLLHLENGNIALTTIVIDGANETSQEKIDEIVQDFKNQFEEQNNIEILKIDYLTQKQAEDFKNRIDNIPTFKKDKFLIILNESITFFNNYLETCCEQLSEIKSKEKDFLVQISLYITNAYYVIQKIKFIQSYIKNITNLKINTPKDLTRIIGDLEFTINFLKNIPHDDHIMFGLQKILNEIKKAN
jgi:hypothetical protein